MVDATSLPPRPLVVDEVDDLSLGTETRDCLPAYVLAHDAEAVVALTHVTAKRVTALLYHPEETAWTVVGSAGVDESCVGVPESVSASLYDAISTLYDAAHVQPWTLRARDVWDGFLGTLPPRPLSPDDLERLRAEWFVAVVRPLVRADVDGQRGAVLVALRLYNPSAGADVTGLAGLDARSRQWQTVDRREVDLEREARAEPGDGDPDGENDAPAVVTSPDTGAALLEWLTGNYDPTRVEFLVDV